MRLRQRQKIQEVLSEVIFARYLVYIDYNHRDGESQPQQEVSRPLGICDVRHVTLLYSTVSPPNKRMSAASQTRTFVRSDKRNAVEAGNLSSI